MSQNSPDIEIRTDEHMDRSKDRRCSSFMSPYAACCMGHQLCNYALAGMNEMYV